MKSTICFGFVIFEPTPRVIERLNLLVDLGYAVFVYDNSPYFNSSLEIAASTRVYYTPDHANRGVGAGLHHIGKSAYELSYEVVIYFDQDTNFDCDTVRFMVDYWEKKRGDPATGFPPALSVTFREGWPVDARDNRDLLRSVEREVCLTISSGTLFKLETLNQLGWHNREMFMDGVDYEICIRARGAGFKVFEVFGAPSLDHTTEQADRSFSIGRFSFRGRAYPVERIKDTARAYLKLFRLAVTEKDFLACLKLSKLISMYFGSQLVIRALIRLRIINHKEA
jgi:rhamnosyltransferase